MAKRALGPAALQVSQAVAKLLPNQDFVVGCSGGADSVALALGAQWAAKRSGVDFQAVVIDHQLQPNSAQVTETVASRLVERGIAVTTIAVEVGPGNMEAAARDARLATLASFGKPVLLGHTLDDQAETVLLGLTRGSGIRSLAGIAPIREPYIRPLLGIRRATTEEACKQWGISYWEDPHNLDPKFLRVRIRHRVLPVLESELGPGISEALARSATLLQQQLVAQNPSEELAENINTTWLAGLDPAQRTNILKLWLQQRGADQLSAKHIAMVDELVTNWHGQKYIDVPNLRIRRKNGFLQAVKPS